MQKKKIWIYAGIAAAVLIIAAVAGIFYWRSRPDGESGDDNPYGIIYEEETYELVEPISHKERLQLLEAAQKVNEHAYMWMVIPGTNISYPIIFDPDNDNAYWETKTLAGEDVENSMGNREETVAYLHYKTLFKDTPLNDEGDTPAAADLSKNLVVFGHNWNNVYQPYVIGDDGEDNYIMFEQLMSFDNLHFAKGHQYIYTSTADGEKIWQIFSVMYTESSWKSELDFNYYEPNPTDEQFETMIDEMLQRSRFNFDVPVTSNDQILTLSTCTRYYENYGDLQRFVVCARLLTGREKADALTEVEINVDVKNPWFVDSGGQAPAEGLNTPAEGLESSAPAGSSSQEEAEKSDDSSPQKDDE